MRLSINLSSPYQLFTEMGIFDLIEVCEDYNDLVRETEREARKEAKRHRWATTM